MTNNINNNLQKFILDELEENACSFIEQNHQNTEFLLQTIQTIAEHSQDHQKITRIDRFIEELIPDINQDQNLLNLAQQIQKTTSTYLRSSALNSSIKQFLSSINQGFVNPATIELLKSMLAQDEKLQITLQKLLQTEDPVAELNAVNERIKELLLVNEVAKQKSLLYAISLGIIYNLPLPQNEENKLLQYEKIQKIAELNSNKKIDILLSYAKKNHLSHEDLFFLLKTIAKLDSAQTLDSLLVKSKDISCMSQHEILELFKLSAMQNGENGYFLFSRMAFYGFKLNSLSPEFQYEFAKIFASSTQGGHIVIDHLNSFPDLTKNQQYEITKTLADSLSNPFFLCSKIDQFFLLDNEMLYSLARQYALNTSSSFLTFFIYYINKFNLSKQQQYEIVEILTQKTPNLETVCHHIDKFSLLDNEQRYSLAQQILQMLGDNSFLLAACIDKFDLFQEQQYEIVEILTQKTSNLETVCHHIDNFSLLDNKQRYSLAQRFLSINGYFFQTVINSLHKFQLSEEQRYTLVSNLLEHRPDAAHFIAKNIATLSLSPPLLDTLIKKVFIDILPETDLSNEKNHIPAYIDLIKNALCYKNIDLKKKLFSSAKTLLRNKSIRQSWNTLRGGKQHKAYLLLALFPSLLKPDSTTLKIINRVLLQKKFKDHNKNGPLLHCLSQIDSVQLLLGRDQSLYLITNILCKDPSSAEKVLNRAAVISLYISLGDTNSLQYIIREKENLPSLEEIVKNSFALSDKTASFFVDKFQKNISNLLVYASRLATLPQEEKNTCASTLNSFVGSIAGGNFPAIRYKKEHNKHLQRALVGNLEQKWQQGAIYPLTDFSFNQEKSSINYRQFFYEKVLTDRHINAEDVPFLVRALKQEISIQEALLTLTTEESAPLQQAQLLILQLIDKNSSNEEEIIPIINALKDAAPNTELLNDLKGLQKTLTAKNSRQPFDPSSYQVLDTDDPHLLLMMGTDVEGSCQRIDSDCLFNKCLLAYLMDGKNRLLAIVDQDKRIVARAVLRLLLNEESKPVLFLERAYFTAHCPDELKEVLLQAAQRRADELQLPLNPNSTLTSLGSPAPFEYVDADGIGVTNGSWIIQSSNQRNWV